jgi:hypothetical protein
MIEAGTLGWEFWFAWRPVRIKDKWVWWRLIERRFCFAGSRMNRPEWWEYRRIPG